MTTLDDMEELTPQEIAQLAERWDVGGDMEIPGDVYREAEMAAVIDAIEEHDPPRRGHYWQPLADATDDFVYQAVTIDSRIYTGIDTFDATMRGLGPKQLMLVQGYTHSGKTLFTTNMIRFNAHRRIAMFTPDEDRVSVLIKLVCIEHGVNALDLEYRISQGDQTAIDLIRATAEERYPNLAVFEDIDDLDTMTRAMEEVKDAWGDKPELVIFDFVDLLTNGDNFAEGATAQKIKAIKSWGRRQAPTVALHQTSRTAGANGAEQTISSGSYGGESAATFLVGVRRKRDYWGAIVRELEERKRRSSKWGKADDDQLDLAKYNLLEHENTVSFSLLKNKRPPCGLVAESDFKLDASTGRISPFERGVAETSTLGAAQRAIVNREMFET